MTAETSTAISSISGLNINTISGATSRPQHVQKRTIHQFETDKIEVQLSEQTQAPPSGISKVSQKLSECPRLHGTGNFPIREPNPIMNFFLSSTNRKLPGTTKSAKRKLRERCSESEMGKLWIFLLSLHILEDDFSHLDDPFSHTPLILESLGSSEWA